MRCMMERLVAQTSTTTVAELKHRHAPKVCINVPKFFEEADPVGCHFTAHTIAGTLDGAPMVSRWHNLEKAAAVTGTDLMANARR